MRRAHVAAISCLLAGCVMAGVFAAMRTMRLGAASAGPRRVDARVIAARRAKLGKWSAALERARRSKPPKLPGVPSFPPVVIPTVPARARTVELSASRGEPAHQTQSATATTTAVKYVQPPPVVQYQQAPASTTGESDEAGDSHEWNEPSGDRTGTNPTGGGD
jgi:hypothetical protein